MFLKAAGILACRLVHRPPILPQQRDTSSAVHFFNDMMRRLSDVVVAAAASVVACRNVSESLCVAARPASKHLSLTILRLRGRAQLSSTVTL